MSASLGVVLDGAALDVRGPLVRGRLDSLPDDALGPVFVRIVLILESGILNVRWLFLADRCGGQGFLGSVVYAFSPLLLAKGTVLAGMMANRIFYAGARLPDFKVEMIGIVAMMVLAVLAPLLVFSLKLEAAKRAGLREHGALAQRYVREYDRKWLRGGASADELLVGNADIQSLADLGNSFEVLKDMRSVPFTVRTMLDLAVVTLLPALPLTLTMISLEELIDRLLKVLL